MQTIILGLITPLMSLCFAATFLVLWRVGRLKRHVLWFAISYVLGSVGYLVTHLAPPNAFWVFHTTQAFYFLSCVILIAAVCERSGQKLHLGSMVLVYAMSALTLGITIHVSSDVAQRLVILNIGYGVVFAMGATTLLNARRRDIVDFVIIALMAFQAADFLIRPTMTLMFERSIPEAVYRESIYYSMIGLAPAVKGIATAMVLIGASIAEWTRGLKDSSARDALTGMLNRGAFEDSMRSMIPRAQAEGRPLSLVVADIDHFKQVNDIWGHQAGDNAITNFGELIRNTVRGCDVGGRIGGEEFCIAVWNCPNEPAEGLAERIRLAFAQMQHDGLNDDIRLTASFGVATAQEGETYRSLFARADAALYLSKSNGRNRVENAERAGKEPKEQAEAPVVVDADLKAAAG